MIYKNNCTLAQEYLERLTEHGLDGLPDLLRVLINQATRIEKENYLHTKSYERNDDRQGHTNGDKSKTVKNQCRRSDSRYPEGVFYPLSLEMGISSERALLLTMVEIFT